MPKKIECPVCKRKYENDKKIHICQNSYSGLCDIKYCENCWNNPEIVTPYYTMNYPEKKNMTYSCKYHLDDISVTFCGFQCLRKYLKYRPTKENIFRPSPIIIQKEMPYMDPTYFESIYNNINKKE